MKTTEQEILEFANRAYGNRTTDNICLKLGEEVGEIFRAVNLRAAGRATVDAVTGEIGDALFVLAQMAAIYDTTLQDLLCATTAKNRLRFLSRHGQRAVLAFAPFAPDDIKA